MPIENPKSKRMPKLAVDEVLLLIDTFFLLKQVDSLSVQKEMISDLSDRQKKLPIFPKEREDPAFRSYAGMQMCLANVAYVDPEQNSKFGHGSALQKRVFDYYSSNRELLHSMALAISAVCAEDFVLLPEYRDFIGGQILPSFHHKLELTSKVVQQVKQNAVTFRRTTCSLCRQDLEKVYGSDAELLLEGHIALPINENKPNVHISSSDVILLCPSCHKLAHSKPDLFSGEQLLLYYKGRDAHV